VQLSARLDDEQLGRLRGVGAFRSFSIRNGHSDNRHGYANSLRCAMARVLRVRKGTGRVLHIAALPGQLFPGDHTCNPMLVHTDAKLRAGLAQAGAVRVGPTDGVGVQSTGTSGLELARTTMTWCSHRVEECDCRWSGCYGTVIAIHSLYGLSAAKLAYVLRKQGRDGGCGESCRLVSFHYTHRPQGQQSFGESEYTCRHRAWEGGCEYVTESFHGGDETYDHATMGWVRACGGCLQVQPGDVTAGPAGGQTHVRRAMAHAYLQIAERFSDVVDGSWAVEDLFLWQTPRPMFGNAPDRPMHTALESSSINVDADTVESPRFVWASPDQRGHVQQQPTPGSVIVCEQLFGAALASDGRSQAGTREAHELKLQRVTRRAASLRLGYMERDLQVRLVCELLGGVAMSDRADAMRATLRRAGALPRWVPSWLPFRSRFETYGERVGVMLTHWHAPVQTMLALGFSWMVACAGTAGALVRYGPPLRVMLGLRVPLAEPGVLLPLGDFWHKDGEPVRGEGGEQLGLDVLDTPDVGVASRITRSGLFATFVGDALLVPLVEEVTRMVVFAHSPFAGWACTLAAMGVEAARGSLLDYFPTGCMHVAAARLGLPGALLLHACWNAVCVHNNAVVLAARSAPVLDGSNAWRRAPANASRCNGTGVVPGAMVVPAICPLREAREPVQIAVCPTTGRFAEAAEGRWPAMRGCGHQFGARLVGVGLACALPDVAASCGHACMEGLQHRVYRTALWSRENLRLGPTAQCIRRLWRRSRRNGVVAILDGGSTAEPGVAGAEPLGPEGLSPTSADELAWLSKYPRGERSTILHHVMLDSLGKRDEARLYGYNAFVKRERKGCPLEKRVTGKPGTPRIIQGRDFAARFYTGPVTWLHTRRLIDAVGCSSERVLATGLGATAEVVGRWADCVDCQGDDVLLDGDLVRQDSTTHPQWVREHTMRYKRLSAPKRAMRILGRREDARGRFRSGTRYATRGSVHSGDGDTSVMNTVDVIMPAEAFLAEAHDRATGTTLDLTGEWATPAGRAGCGLFTGDGLVMRVPRAAWRLMGGESGLVAAYAAAGFELEINVVESPVQLSFCSSTWWPTTSGYSVVGPLPGKVLAKNMWTLRDEDREADLDWLRGVVAGMRLRTAHVPFLRVVYGNYYVALGCSGEDLEGARGDQAAPWRALPDEAHDGGDHAVWAAMDRYGMSHASVRELEGWLDHATKDGPCQLLEHPALELLVNVDV